MVNSASNLTRNNQEQATNSEIHQITDQLDQASVKLVNDCMTFTSIADLTGCKSTLTDLKNKCKGDPQYSSMSVCSDASINQFLSSVDSKIIYAEDMINNDGSKLVDGCVHLIALTGNNQECITDMQTIQQECNQYNIGNHMTVCSDQRVSEILTGSITSQVPVQTVPNFNQSSQNAINFVQSTNQNTLSTIDSCMKATDPSVIQYCSQTAQKILDYCNHVSSVGIEQICNDPRLKQLDNQTTNSIIQTTQNMTSQTTTSSSCPATFTYDVIVIKNSMGNSLFNPQILNLQEGDDVIFKSSDGKPHLLTSNNDGLRDWFLQNGALISNDQSIKLQVMIFGDKGNVFNVFDSYDPHISMTLDVKSTPVGCPK